MLILARMASARSPLPITTSTPVSRSVATARNGIGSSSKSSTNAALRVSSFRIKPRFWPVTRPPPSRIPSMLTPIPEAYRAATAEPALVPTTMSTGTFISSSARNTPTWAMPLAPPPLSTRPTLGRTSGRDWAQAGAASMASNVSAMANSFGGLKIGRSVLFLVIVGKGKVGDIRYYRRRNHPVYAKVGAGRCQGPVVQVLKHGGFGFLVFHQRDSGRVQAQAGTGQDVIHFFTRNGQSVTRLRFGRFTGSGGSVLRSTGSCRCRAGGAFRCRRCRFLPGLRPGWRCTGHRFHIGHHAMLFQNRLVFFGLYLLKLVADNHRLTAEHAVKLLDTGLEQGLCVIANRSRVGARHALPFEHKLEHSFASLFFADQWANDS